MEERKYSEPSGETGTGTGTGAGAGERSRTGEGEPMEERKYSEPRGEMGMSRRREGGEGESTGSRSRNPSSHSSTKAEAAAGGEERALGLARRAWGPNGQSSDEAELQDGEEAVWLRKQDDAMGRSHGARKRRGDSGSTTAGGEAVKESKSEEGTGESLRRSEGCGEGDWRKGVGTTLSQLATEAWRADGDGDWNMAPS